MSSPDPDYIHYPSNRTDPSLKPRKTTRTMNPHNKSTINHVNMINKTTKGTFQKVVTRLASMANGEAMDIEGLEYG